MKILYLANARIPTPRAYGLTIIKTCEALANQDAEVELIAPTRSYKTDGDPFVYYGAQRNFKMTTVRVPDFLFLGPLGFLLSTVWFAERIRWMRSFRNADVVCSRDALLLVQYALLGKKLVFETHARPSVVSVFVARHAHRVISISKGLKDAYVARGVAPERIVVAPAAVDEHLFDTFPGRGEARAQLGLAASASIVLYAGHLYPRKGAETLAKAAALIPEAHIIFVGGAPEDLAAFRARWDKTSNIQSVGHVPHEKIPLYLRAADLLVVPNSAKDDDAARFTSPMKLFEYMLSGTPIVTSDVPAVREILDGTMAVFVAPDDATALAKGIQESLSEPEKARERARLARVKVGEYTWSSRAHIMRAALT
jgi:glycosyltransferase involved in cell wall biosynthesis